MKRAHQMILITSVLVASWLGMQAVHECGHVLGAVFSGGTIKQVVLNPLTISRTDLATNPNPLLVVWAGPSFGVLFPLVVWGVMEALRIPGAFIFRFFAGFCCIANGGYIAGGSFSGIGDCGEMLRNGSALWHLWLFGAITVPVGFWMWHHQGASFGLGSAHGTVSPVAAYVTLGVAILLLVLGISVGGA